MSKIVVDLAALGQASAGTVDEVTLPQPAECLVTGYIAVAVQPGKEFRKVVCAVGVRGTPEPELSMTIISD